MQGPVRPQASVTLPGTEPLEAFGLHMMERQIQKKVVLNQIFWQAGCKFLQSTIVLRPLRRSEERAVLQRSAPALHAVHVTHRKPRFPNYFPHEMVVFEEKE